MNLKLIRKVFIAVLAFSIPCAELAPGQAQRDTSQEAALRQIQSQFAAAWNRADASAISALFAPDGDLIIPTGLVLRGRSEITAFYSGVFASGYAGSVGSSEIASIRFIKSDVALLDATWSIKNVHDAKGASAPDESGILALLATKGSSGWHIAALREHSSASSFQSPSR